MTAVRETNDEGSTSVTIRSKGMVDAFDYLNHLEGMHSSAENQQVFHNDSILPPYLYYAQKASARLASNLNNAKDYEPAPLQDKNVFRHCGIGLSARHARTRVSGLNGFWLRLPPEASMFPPNLS